MTIIHINQKQRKFDAILAKNNIAREISEKEINRKYILNQLEEIEKYIGKENQPRVKNIYENNSNKNRRFTI